MEESVTTQASFSDHEKKLFRRRLFLGPVTGVSGLAAVVPIALRANGWWIALSFAALAIAFIAGAGLVATERATDLSRFDTELAAGQRDVVVKARRLRGWASNAFFLVLVVLGAFDRLTLDSSMVAVVALVGAGCGLCAAWLLRREAAAVWAVGGL